MKNCIWMSAEPAHGREAWRRQLGQCRAAGLDSVVLLASNGTEALYESRHLPVKAALLEELLPLAAAEGLEVHAWIVSLRCTVSSVLQEHADWYSVNRNGDSSHDKPPYIPSYRWLCPTRLEVREYLCSLVDELAQYDGVTGVHLDYIRHPDVILPVRLRSRYGLVEDRESPEFDFCYCDECRRVFAERTGRDPLELEDPASDEEWRHFRWDALRDTVSAAADTAHSRDRVLTAAVFPTPALSRRYVRQQWERWDVDAVLPLRDLDAHDLGTDLHLGLQSSFESFIHRFDAKIKKTKSRTTHRMNTKGTAPTVQADGISPPLNPSVKDPWTSQISIIRIDA